MAGKSKYETNILPHLAEIPEWIKTMTEGQIADRCGVVQQTFIKYKAAHPELHEALNAGNAQLVTELRSALKKKALGFTYEETKTYVREENGQRVRYVEKYERYSPPDTGACHLLLKNLCDDWRNDDGETIRLKREKLELEKQKAESENW